MRQIANFAADFEDALTTGMTAGLMRMDDVAIQKSSGPYSQAWLDRNDNPLARRHGSPQIDASTINVQTGAFRADWRALPLRIGNGEIHAVLINDNPVADFLKFGTKNMFDRPIEAAVEQLAEPLIIDAIEKELERLFSTDYS